ncbi:MAG: hypothetical protein R3322_00325 [Kiloniellales bacterium]|nr:hypothetical protein [Kiloniellales bacterium]
MAKKLYGAAAKAHAKRLAKLRRRKTRKNPARKRRRRTTAAAKRRRPARRRTAARKNPTRRRRRAVAAAPRRRRRTAARKNPTRRRRRAVAAAPRRRRRYRRNPSDKPKLTKTQRRHRTKWKAIRRRASKGPGSRGGSPARGIRGLWKARRSIIYQKGYGNAAARNFMKRYRMRSNPRGALIDSVKMAIPVAGSMYAAKAAVTALDKQFEAQLARLGKFSKPVLAGAVLAAGAFITARIKAPMVQQNRQHILMGLGVNLLDTSLRSLMPEQYKKYLGASVDDAAKDAVKNGDSAAPTGGFWSTGDIYDQGLSEYVEMGQYEAELGEYVQLGAEEELGELYHDDLSEYVELGAFEAELGADDVAPLPSATAPNALPMPKQGPASQIGSGIGTPWNALVGRVPRRSMVAAVPAKSFVKAVPSAQPSRFDKMSSLYTGIFRGGFGC